VNDVDQLDFGGIEQYQCMNCHTGGVMADIINLMIVDDSSRARSALEALLSLRRGLKIIARASNGLEAVNMIEEFMPDVVLMDAKMPVMDGLEATRIIKSRWPCIKVVILSMYSEFITEAFSNGADEFLVKGCSVDEILSAIAGLPGKQACEQLRLIERPAEQIKQESAK